MASKENMRNIKVVVQGSVKGTYSQDKVVAALRAGEYSAATFYDAQGGGIITPDEIFTGDQQATPWEAEASGHPGRPTSRYQRLAMEENNRETKNLQGNPYSIGQEGYTSHPKQEYSRSIGGSPESYGVKSNPATPWGGIAAVAAAIFFWPLGLILGFRARKDAQQNGNSTALSTTAIVISICSAAIFGVLIYNANAGGF